MTASDPERSYPETLAFVAPGFVHRIGNLMFTIQGHAQLMGRAAGNDRGVAPILNAAERGGQTLAVVRTLLGSMGAAQANARELIEAIVDIVRIPVREAGQTLVCTVADATHHIGVDPGAFCPAVLETVRQFAVTLRGNQGGEIGLALAAGPGASVFVRVQHTPAEGSLPFPLAVGQLRAALELALAALPRRPRIACSGQAIELAFGATERSVAAAEQA